MYLVLRQRRLTIDRLPGSMNRMDRHTFRLASFGVRVGTRLEGKIAREKLLTALETLSEPGRLTISLDGIEVLSGSFADEAVALSYARLITGEYGDRYMIVRSPVLEITEDLSSKLERRRMAMLCSSNDGWDVLGLLGTQIKETLALVIDRRETTAKELASLLGIRHNACLRRVGRLAELRLIRREEVGLAGPYHSYRFFSILNP